MCASTRPKANSSLQVKLSLNGIEFDASAGQLFYYAFEPEVTAVDGLQVKPKPSEERITFTKGVKDFYLKSRAINTKPLTLNPTP